MAVELLLLLLMQLHCQFVHGKTITVSNNGTISVPCCINGDDCTCSSLEYALQNIDRSTTLINITSSLVVLNNPVNITKLDTIKLVGNNDTVISCNDTGHVSFLDCKNVSILDITWDHCGNVSIGGGVSVNYSESLSISSCKFQHSIAYGITIKATTGVINITDTKILNNSVSSNASGFLLYQANDDGKLELNIINCSFKFNGKSFTSFGGGISIMAFGLTSILSVLIENCVISNNRGKNGGGICINAKVNNFSMEFINITLIANHALTSDEIYCEATGGKNASLIVKGGIIQGSGSINVLHFASMVTSILMEDLTIVHATEQRMLIQAYNYNNVTIRFMNASLIKTRLYFIMGRSTYHPESCILKFDNVTASNNSGLKIDGSESNGFQCKITNCLFLNSSDTIPVLDIHNKIPDNNNPDSTETQIISSTFTDNKNGGSVVSLVYDDNNAGLGKVLLSSTIFANNIDNDNTFYLYYCNLTISNKTVFKGNSALKGAGIFLTNFSTVTLHSHAEVEFIDNTAALGGGAIYANYIPPVDSCSSVHQWNLFYTADEYTARFVNNHANAAGNSIFLSIPSNYANCFDRSNTSLLYISLTHFNCIGHNEIATSPYNLQLDPPAICNGSCDDGGNYQVKGIMLGEAFSIVTKMVDYYNFSAEPTLFEIKCKENCQSYYITGTDNFQYEFIETNKTISMSIIGDEVKTDSIVVLEISSVVGTINSDVRTIKVDIEVTLTSCHFGFIYNENQNKCVCNEVPGIVKCGADDIRLKWGYWYGIIDNSIVTGHCPNDYCKYATSCASSDKFCDLSSDQCSPHRTGPACGKCEENYELAYDSSDCVKDSHCSAGRTAGIIILTVIYWFVVSFIIIFMRYFIAAPTLLGYVYGITYFYSVIDLLVSNNLPISNGVIRFTEILSGLVNLTPRFLGTLCLTKGLSGIDQQFIHYIHPFVISLLLYLIPKVASCRPFATVCSALNRLGTLRSLCLLLLLSYTSISTTSLKLLLPLMFKGTNTVYAYYSPDIKYFSGRHVVYGVIALFLTVVIVLGLPIFLLIQPLLRKYCQNIPFIRIQPILDQFQQCYERERHSAAAIYLICRLLIFLIVGLNSIEYVTSYFILQVLCFIVAVLHILLQPYRNDTGVNSLDHIILLITVMVVSLNTNNLFTSLGSDKAVNDFIVTLFVLLPLITFIGFLILIFFKKKYPGSELYSRLELHYIILVNVCIL